MSAHICQVALGVLAMCIGASVARATEGPWRRCAVVSSEEVRRSGLGDLVTAELNKVKDLELVERDELARLENELQLSQLVGAQDAANRLRLGRRLRADCLVLLVGGGKEPLEMLIAECLQGARLHRQEIILAEPGQAARRVKDAVLATRRRFPRGATCLVGVSEFLDRNLTRDFNVLRSGYARLLAGALSVAEGAAVLEIDEARAISRELAGQALGPRQVPLLVEGEFRMEGQPGLKSTKVVLTVFCRGGLSDRKIMSPELPLAAVPRWIVGDLASQIAAGAAGQIPLDVDAQVKLFSARADEFLRLADVEQAVPLRESVLLLKPDRTDVRLVLLGERLELIQHCAADSRKVEVYLQSLEDLQLLIDSRQIDRVRGLALAARVGGSLRPARAQRVGGQQYYCPGWEERAHAQKPMRQFYLEVIPKLRDLPPPEKAWTAVAQGNYLRDWQRVFLSGVASRADVPYLIAKDLKDLELAYTSVLPEDLPIETLALPGPGIDDGPRAATDEEYREFYRALAASHHKTSSLRGRYALLADELARAQMTPEVAARKGASAFYMQAYQGFRKEPIPRQQALAFVERARELQADYLTLRREPGMPPAQSDGGWQDLTRLRRETELALQPREIPLRLAPGQPQPAPGAVRLTPLPIQARRLDGSVERHRDLTNPTFLGFSGMSVLARGDNCDAYWNPESIYLMRKEGIIEEIFCDLSCEIRRLAWDGRRFWLVRGDEVWLVDGDGQLRAKVGRQLGLPPGVSIVQPTAPGAALALGSFDDPPRAWAATITSTDRGDPTVKVFFEAKNVVRPETRRPDDDESPHIGFCVGRTHLYHPQDKSNSPLLLVMRTQRSPLQIDVETLAVTRFSHSYEGFRGGQILLSRDGTLWTTDYATLRIVTPPGRTWPDGTVAREIEVVNPPRPAGHPASAAAAERVQYLRDDPPVSDPVLLDPGDGYLYYAGRYWYRIKLSTMEAQRLTSFPDEIPGTFAVARNYGLVQWNQGVLLRITIDEASIPPSGRPIAK